MEILEAQMKIQLHLKGACIQQVYEDTAIAISTLYRWKDKIIQYPHLGTFVKLCDYYGIVVSIQELRKLA